MSGPDPRAGREAARLLAAAQDWLRTSAPHLAPVGPDGEPCSCPLCRAVAGLREADPDSVGRWVDSAVAAVGALVDQAGDLAARPTAQEAEATAETEDRTSEGYADGPDDAPHDEAGTARGDRSRAGSGVEDATDEQPPGQDGPRPRRVRRVPITGESGTSTS